MSIAHIRSQAKGDRFRVVYRLASPDEGGARAQAQEVCVEQTVEFPADLLPQTAVPPGIVGEIEALQRIDESHFEAVISYAVEITGPARGTAPTELPQLLNVVFGNSSMQPGVRVQELRLPDSLLGAFRGPRFGRDGLRRLLRVPERPLLCTAIKPIGLSSQDLARMAYQFALGGIDIIKDDHGLTNQAFAPFHERVQRCAEAVARANADTGRASIYAPNITGPADEVHERARFAREMGAGGLLIVPGLTGFDTMRLLADDDEIALPILSHPSFVGSFIVSRDSGIAPGALFGQIMRLAGADGSIYAHQGGRFSSFSTEDCRDIVHATAAPMGQLKPIFPVPGGGMSLPRVPDMLEIYGREVIFLIGGALHRHGPDLAQTARQFQELVQRL